MYRERLGLCSGAKPLTVHRTICRVSRRGVCGAGNTPKRRHVQNQEARWDYGKQLSHCCGKGAAEILRGFNRSFPTLVELAESSLVVDDILTYGLRDVGGVDDGATIGRDVTKVNPQKKVKLTLLIKNV